jgi:hypothetical protein
MPPPPPLPSPGGSHFQPERGDILHTNSIKVLPKSLASKFPMFKAGHVLLSLRSPHVLAVLDIEKRSIVWAARGPWLQQHDAQFLENGRLLLFDNVGSSQGSRAIEFDPATHAIPWSYGGTKYDAFPSVPFRGACQRLSNGNTLLIDPGSSVMEVTPKKEVAWQWGFKQGEPRQAHITFARRLRAEDTTFLKGARNARPK